MEVTKKLFLPGNFMKIDGRTYFRLEDGKIAVDETENIIIELSNKDVVELITLECDSKKVRFWKTKGKIYALTSSSFVTILEDTTFVDCYVSDNYPVRTYIKYKSSNKYGIIEISTTEVTTVISHEKGYIEISFENNYFYADCENGDNKYHILEQSGKVLGKFPDKVKKIKDSMLFYDKNGIYLDSDSNRIDIPEGVLSVEVVKSTVTLIKVISNNGIYYYTQELNYLCGPIQKDQIYINSCESCFIYELVENKIMKVFLIEEISGKYHCKRLFSKNQIKPWFIKLAWRECNFFEVDNIMYILEGGEFIPIIKNVSLDRYVLHYKKTSYHDWGNTGRVTILGYKKNEPVYLAYYELKYKSLSYFGKIDKIRNYSNIYRQENNIVVIKPNGEIVFSTTGKDCHKKQYKCKTVYVVEKEDDEIEIYNEEGKEI